MRRVLSLVALIVMAGHPVLAAEGASLCGPVPIEELAKASFTGTEWRFLGEAWRASGTESHVGLKADGTTAWHDGDPSLPQQIARWEFVEDPNLGRGLFLLGSDGSRVYAFPTRSIGEKGETSLSGVRYGGDEQAALLPVCPQPATSSADGGKDAQPIPLEQAALTGTAWIIVQEDGSPRVKDLVLDVDGTIGGDARGGMYDGWQVTDGKLVLSSGGAPSLTFDSSSISPNGRPTLKGHAGEDAGQPVRMISVLPPETVSSQMTAAALTGTNWQLRNDDGDVARERIGLAADGRVEGVPAGDVWIDGWSVADGELTLSKSGRANFRFSFPTEDGQGRRVLNGYLTANPYQSLTLVELAVAP